MNTNDEAILRAFFRYQECQRQRLWLQRLWHPELFSWAKRGAPPPMTATKQIRLEELANLGFDEQAYQHWLLLEENTQARLEALGNSHPLWEHLAHIKGFGPLTCAKYVAAVGDIARPGTVSQFWSGMGLGLKDGHAPRRVRGHKPKLVTNAEGEEVWEHTIPALPHVTLIGEQIRTAFMLARGKLHERYQEFRERYDAAYPEGPKLFNHKRAQRAVQKLLYGCLWREHRLTYGLTAPDPYAFDILKHRDGSLVRIEDLYDR